MTDAVTPFRLETGTDQLEDLRQRLAGARWPEPAPVTDWSQGVHVVCPSLPGYGFSDKPAEPGWDIGRIAEAWAALMARLGYDRYGAQGGDWGGFVSSTLGQRDAAHVTGVHVNMAIVGPDPDTVGDLTEFEQRSLADLGEMFEWGVGYAIE